MKIRALRPQHGSYGSVDRGGVIDVGNDKAKTLIKTGNWVPANYAAKKEAPTKNKKAPTPENKSAPLSEAGPRGGRPGSPTRSS